MSMARSSGALLKYGRIELAGDATIGELSALLGSILKQHGYPEAEKPIDFDKLAEAAGEEEDAPLAIEQDLDSQLSEEDNFEDSVIDSSAELAKEIASKETPWSKPRK
jgi:hypothetical protein